MTTPIQEAFAAAEERLSNLDDDARSLSEARLKNRMEASRIRMSLRLLATKMIEEEGISALAHPSVAAEVAKAFGLRRRDLATGIVPNSTALQDAAQEALDTSYTSGAARLHFTRDLLAHPSLHITLGDNDQPIDLPHELPGIFEAVADAEPLFHLSFRVLNAPGNPDRGTREKARMSKAGPGEYTVTLDYERGEPSYVTFATFEEAIKFAWEQSL